MVECYILIAWVTMLLVVLVGFGVTITLKNYGLFNRPTKEANMLLLECYILIGWVALLLVGVVGFIHCY